MAYRRVAPDEAKADAFASDEIEIGDNLNTIMKKSYHWGHGSTTFLITLGILTSITAWCMDEGAALISHYAWVITDSFGGCCDQNESWCYYGTVTCPNTVGRWHDNVPRYVIWVVCKLATVAAAVVFTHKVGPLAKGSGIPEMRTIIGGFDWGIEGGYLSFRTLMAKVIGLTLCLGGGLDVGKEGPFVHTSCVLAYQMLQLRRFEPLHSSNELSNHILSAAVAVGVAATFGAPIGGVLFSIEVTSVFYKSSNYWKAFLCAICGCLVFKALGFVASDRDSQVALLETHFEPLPYHWWELPIFVMLGAVCGIIGALFTRLFAFAGQVQGRHGDTWRGVSAMVLILIFACTEFPMGGFMTMSLTKSMGDLFCEQSLESGATDNGLHHNSWHKPSVFLNLVLYCVLKFVFCAIAITLPVPAGCVTPTFALGAGVGRLLGEVIVVMSPTYHIVPGGYAVVGAAAFCAAVTNTISPAVIVFELTAQLSYSAPVLLATQLARATAAFFGPSLFDSIALKKKLPSWPVLKRERSHKLVAADVMTPIVPRHASTGGADLGLQLDGGDADGPAHSGSGSSGSNRGAGSGGGGSEEEARVPGGSFSSDPVLDQHSYIDRRSTLRQLQTILWDGPPALSFPVVDSEATMVLVGVVEAAQLQAVLEAWVRVHTAHSDDGGDGGDGDTINGDAGGQGLGMAALAALGLTAGRGAKEQATSTAQQQAQTIASATATGHNSRKLIRTRSKVVDKYLGNDRQGRTGAAYDSPTTASNIEMGVAHLRKAILGKRAGSHNGAKAFARKSSSWSAEESSTHLDLEERGKSTAGKFGHLTTERALRLLQCVDSLDKEVDWIGSGLLVLADSRHSHVSASTPLAQVFFTFSVQKCTRIFVTRSGILVGQVELASVDQASGRTF